MISTAKLKVYALPVHSSSSSVAPRSRQIAVRAVATPRRSRTTMNDPNDVRASTHPCFDVIRFAPVVMCIGTGQRSQTHRSG